MGLEYWFFFFFFWEEILHWFPILLPKYLFYMFNCLLLLVLDLVFDIVVDINCLWYSLLEFVVKLCNSFTVSPWIQEAIVCRTCLQHFAETPKDGLQGSKRQLRDKLDTKGWASKWIGNGQTPFRMGLQDIFKMWVFREKKNSQVKFHFNGPMSFKLLITKTKYKESTPPSIH